MARRPTRKQPEIKKRSDFTKRPAEGILAYPGFAPNPGIPNPKALEEVKKYPKAIRPYLLENALPPKKKKR